MEYKQGGYVWYGLQSGHQWHYVFTDAHLFELKVERFWLTHVKIIDPLLIEHQAELEAWMESKRGWERYGRLKGRSNWWNKSPLQRKLEARAQRDLRRFVANPEEAEMSLRMMQFRFSLFVLIFPHVAQCRGTPAQNGDSTGANPVVGTISPCSPNQQRRSFQKGEVAGANPALGTFFAPVAQ